MLSRLVLLGAGGDLTARLLLPALASLVEVGAAPSGFEVVGVARDDLDDEQFVRQCEQALGEFAPDVSAESRQQLLSAISYVRADVTDPADLARALPDGEACAVYLALPNAVFLPTCRALAEVGLAEGSVLVVEKPFGTSLDSARELNEAVLAVVPEEQVFRVDHFLAMQTVVNVLGLRFANRVLEPLWSRDHIERVDVVFDETLALEGRAGYYDSAGALVDMLQNHLLQVLALVAMEPPASLDEHALRDRKVQLLKDVRAPGPSQLATRTVRGRYTTGEVGGRALQAYVDEDGVDRDRGTETYAEVWFEVDNPRWAGVPFVLRSGKALAEDRQEVVVTFRAASDSPFTGPVVPNRLRLGMLPDSVRLELNVNGPGDPFKLEAAGLALPLPPRELSAYALLLKAVLLADPTLSIRGDEAEQCWRIVAPVLAAWSDGSVPLLDYPAGSTGPVRTAGRR